MAMGMTQTQRAARARPQLLASDHWPERALRIAGAGLLAATGAIHLDLYLTGYRSIPTIGWLFLLQVIAAFALAALVAVSRSWLASAAGAGFALSTLGGYLLSVWVGLFGFTEVRTTAGIVAGVLEVAAFAVLAAATLMSGPSADSGRPTAGPGRPAGGSPPRRAGLAAAAAGISVLALVLLGVAAAAAGGQTPATAGGLKTVSINGVRVLASSRGLTLYWFAPDTPTSSACTGSCAAYWPPVKGPAVAATALPGRLGTDHAPRRFAAGNLRRAPLYTYIADSAPGQARGNNLNLNGGLWHEVTVR